MQIVIPAAGNGQRFIDAGYKEPKHLIPVCGTPMVDMVISNILPPGEHEVQVITKRELTKPSRGAIETILQADLDPDQPLLLANCDQLAAFNPTDFVDTDLDGRLVVFPSNKPHHSYVEVAGGVIVRIVEKEVISNLAVTGIYFFKRAADFMEAGQAVIEQDKRVRGEFYVSSAIEQMIRSGKQLGVYQAPSAMLGTPEELQLFEMAVEVAKWTS